ncbi:MAG: phosphoribosylanthranilate isomerase [Aurantibacter sp.]
MKLKVCGMKYNTLEVAELRPDYLGFIFWEPSKRFFEGEIPDLPDSIKKVGVFVDASIEDILEKIETHDLNGIQLHGKESPEYCEQLSVKCQTERRRSPRLIKVFSIKDNFDFDVLKPYEKVCDYYLFDTKGKLPGGNSYTFNWEVLRKYPSTKPYFLSGGIGLAEIEAIKEFMQRHESKYCHVIDVNSRFEIEPGLKNIDELKEFKKVLGTK